MFELRRVNQHLTTFNVSADLASFLYCDEWFLEVLLALHFTNVIVWQRGSVGKETEVVLFLFFSASINCLVADGKKFAHPLHHLGKSEKDLPVLAIDSFRHMYLFPDMTQLTYV